jgi:hypothetical protein
MFWAMADQKMEAEVKSSQKVRLFAAMPPTSLPPGPTIIICMGLKMDVVICKQFF